MRITERPIATDSPMFVIAEMSGNHNQGLDKAKAMLRGAAEAGADAVKLQTYTADTLTIDCDTEPFQIRGDSLWAGKTLYDLYQEAYTPWEWHEELMDEAKRLGLICFSTPFDTTAVDFLEGLDVPAYKIASFECVDLELIAYTARTGKPMIISTGMATDEEIDDAVRTARDAGCEELALMRCNSGYPAEPSEMDLRTIPDMMERWDCPVGLSDHTLGPEAALVARSLGASMLEKHYKLDDATKGPDTEFSMPVSEFKDMVRSIRQAEAMLGGIRYGPTKKEEGSLVFRRSIFAVKDIKKGEKFTRENIRVIRPGSGLAPKVLPQVLGRAAKSELRRGAPLRWDDVVQVQASH